MVLVGVMLGLGAAIAQSLSYIFSRLYVIRRDQAIVRLLILGHLIMGALSLLAMPLLPLASLPPVRQYALPLVGACVFYLLGQVGMFMMLRQAEASRASPLLGLKVLILAMIYLIFRHQPLSGGQWLAVALSVLAAFLLRTSGRRLGVGAVAWIIFACLAYSLSDMSIRALVDALGGMGKLYASATGVCLSYILCGALALAVLPWSPRGHRGDWHYALPWALSWWTAMLLLFGCFGTIDVIYGNIVQSTRGLISILMGPVVAWMGHVHLEPQVPRAVFLRRLLAGCVMFLAIVIF